MFLKKKRQNIIISLQSFLLKCYISELFEDGRYSGAKMASKSHLLYCTDLELSLVKIFQATMLSAPEPRPLDFHDLLRHTRSVRFGGGGSKRSAGAANT